MTQLMMPHRFQNEMPFSDLNALRDGIYSASHGQLTRIRTAPCLPLRLSPCQQFQLHRHFFLFQKHRLLQAEEFLSKTTMQARLRRRSHSTQRSILPTARLQGCTQCPSLGIPIATAFLRSAFLSHSRCSLQKPFNR